MNKSESKGLLFKQALQLESPLQIAGVIYAYAALMAEHVGFNALYLSGAGVANASFGMPDLGMTTVENVLEDVRRVSAATKLPLIVDADTAWDDPSMTVKSMIEAGAAAIHIEDQVEAKRCGHRPNKSLVSLDAMCDRLKAAVDGKTDNDFVIMARTDALASEGLPAALERVHAYIESGADMIFFEAATSLEEYEQVTSAINVPVLANLTEFGKTPLFTLEELKSVGVAMALYPLSAFRAMNQAALNVYETLRKEGTQKACLASMQTREELYQFLDYYDKEPRA